MITLGSRWLERGGFRATSANDSCYLKNNYSLMSKITEIDEHGRVTIPQHIRETHGERYRIVELADRIQLIPLNDDPVAGMRAAVGDTLDDISLTEIKSEAYGVARDNAVAEGPDDC